MYIYLITLKTWTKNAKIKPSILPLMNRVPACKKLHPPFVRLPPLGIKGAQLKAPLDTIALCWSESFQEGPWLGPNYLIGSPPHPLVAVVFPVWRSIYGMVSGPRLARKMNGKLLISIEFNLISYFIFYETIQFDNIFHLY